MGRKVRVSSEKKTAPVKKQEGMRKAALTASALLTGFKPAYEVLTQVRAVPTIFPSFDHGTRVGGLPIERITVIHGPSNEGKTSLAMGFICSFLEVGNPVLHVDAERTTDIVWAKKLLQLLATSPIYYAERPDSYETAVDTVRDFCLQVKDVRKSGRLSKDGAGLIVVDSLRKLVPKNILKRLLKEGSEGEKGSVDGMGGRAAQIKAALNAAWLDELIPLLEDTGCALVLIARETDDPDADIWDKKRGTNFKIGGGKAVVYDASLCVRVQRQGWVSEGGDDDKKIVGERIQATIWKTKVAAKAGRVTDCFFHLSNGEGVEEGFDTARDILELGVKQGVIEVAGSWHKYGEHKWKSKLVAHRALHANRALLGIVDTAVRATFQSVEPATYDEETGEVIE